MAELRIQITGDVNDLNRALDQASGSLDRLGNDAVRAAADLNRLSGAEDRFSASSSRARNAIKPFLDEIRKTPASLNAANGVLNDTNRIIQDMPFGFQGIGNNITELPAKFGRLSAAAKEAGVSVGSLLFKSLGGVGGIGLVISSITSALTLSTIGFGAWTRGIGGAKKEVSEAEVEFELFKRSIEGVGDAFKNLSTSLDFETKLNNIRLQIAGFKGGALAVREANDQITQNAKKVTDLDQRIFNLRVRFNDLKRPIVGLSEGSATLRDLINQFGDSLPDNLIEDLDEKDKELAQKLKTANDGLQKLLKERSDIVNENRLLNEQASLGLLQSIQEGDAKALEELKKLISKAEEIQSRFPELVRNKIDTLFDNFNTQVEKARVIVRNFELGFPDKNNPSGVQTEIPEITLPKAKINILSPEFQIPGAPKELSKQLNFELTPAEKALKAIAEFKKKAEETAQAISGVLGSAVNGLFQSILQGENIVKGFFNAFKQAVLQLVQQLIQAAIRALVLRIILKGVSIGIPGGLGGAIGSLPRFAAGGRIGGPSIVGEQGPEIFVPDVPGRIIPNNQISGAGISGAMAVSGQLIAKGQDLVALITMVNKQNGRTY